MKELYKQRLAVVIVIYFFMFIASMIINLLAVILSPLIVWFSMRDNAKGKIPKIFNWFLTHDNPIDGDEGHLERHPKEDYLSIYKRRVFWICRNKGYTFDYNVCGTYLTGPIRVKGNPNTSDQREAGYLFQVDDNGIFEYYLIYRYPFLKSHCFRVRLGWKFNSDKVNTGEKVMLATSIGFFKKFTGKN